jgi:hypothetical protein
VRSRNEGRGLILKIFSPGLADELVGRLPMQGFEAFGEVMGGYEDSDVSLQVRVPEFHPVGCVRRVELRTLRQ